MNKRSERIKNLVLLAILAALIVGLQFIGGINIGPVSITLTLIPIVAGSIILGPAYGTVLGLVFGLIVSVFSVTGRDPGGQMVFAFAPVLSWFFCLIRGAVVGLLPALVYRTIKGNKLASYMASMIAPVANTGIFIVGMLLFYRPLLETWAGGQNTIVYALIGLAGINFLIEFAVAVILAPAVALVVKNVQPRPLEDGVINKSSVGACVLFSVISFGMFILYWQYLLVRNTKVIKNDDSSCAEEMLCWFLVPFYGVYWWFTRGRQVKETLAEYNHRVTGNEIIYLLFSLFGLTIISMAIMQKDFNSVPDELIQSISK